MIFKPKNLLIFSLILAVILAGFAAVLLFSRPAPVRVAKKELPRPGTTMPSTTPKEIPPPPPRPGLPNIILFSIDTLRADHLGSYGYSRDTSPNIDAFGKDAIVFEQALSQAPVTTPSHMSIFTGLAPAVHQMAMEKQADKSRIISSLDPHIPTFTELLHESGYVTIGLHGGGMVSSFFGFDRGFDLYSSRLLSFNWARAYRDATELKPIETSFDLAREEKRPLFLFLHHYVCHIPYISAPDGMRFRFLEKKTPGLPIGMDDESREMLFDKLARYSESVQGLLALRRFKAFMGMNFWKNVNLAQPEHLEHITALYDSSVLYSDFLFGQVLDILKRVGAYENTLIILTSDHGEELYEHEDKGHWRLFVETLHVPLIIRVPRSMGPASAPARIPTMVRSMDIFPTVFDLLGLSIGHAVQGRSFKPLLEKSGQGYRPLLVSYADTLKEMRLIQDAWVYSDQQTHHIRDWLFDAKADSREMNNLASRKRDLVTSFQESFMRIQQEDEAFRKELISTGAERPKVVNRPLMERLRALGYLEDASAEDVSKPSTIDQSVYEQLRALGYVE